MEIYLSSYGKTKTQLLEKIERIKLTITRKNEECRDYVKKRDAAIRQQREYQDRIHSNVEVTKNQRKRISQIESDLRAVEEKANE